MAAAWAARGVRVAVPWVVRLLVRLNMDVVNVPMRVSAAKLEHQIALPAHNGACRVCG